MPLLLPQDAYDTNLTSPISASATTIAVDKLPIKTAGYLTIFELDGITFREKIKYTGISGTPGDSGNLTGCVRKLALVDSAGVVVDTTDATLDDTPHPAGARIAMSVNQSYGGHILAVLNGDEAFGGVPQNPASRSINTPRDLVDKEYADGVSASGVPFFMVTQNGADPSLTINVGSGYFISGTTPTSFAGASAQAVTPSQTNYVQLTQAGALVINTSSFVNGNIPLAIVVADGTDITSITDTRAFVSIPLTPDQLAAIAGTSGTPSSTNKFVTNLDTSSGVDQQQTTRDASVTVGEADATTKHTILAQSFTAGTINSTGVELYKDADTGSFTGTVTVSLQANSAGSPSGVALATVTIANAAWLLQNAGAFLARWGTAYNAMTVGSLYWYVIETSTTDNANHPNLGTNSAGGYSSGSVKFKNTTDGWVAISTIDLYFRGLTTRANKIVRADSTGNVIAQLPYAVTAGSNDAYEGNFITDDIGYVDGRLYALKLHTANTTGATANLNGWGAKTIKKFHDQDLATGDFEADQIAVFSYNSTADVLEVMSQLARTGGLGPLGAWDNTSYSNSGTNYQAPSDGIVVAYITTSGGGVGLLVGKSDATTTPTVVRAQDGCAASSSTSITYPVKSGDYFSNTGSGAGLNTLVVNFIPFTSA